MIASRSILLELVSGRGTARRVVEGKPRCRFHQDERHDSTNVTQHIPRWNAQRGNPGPSEIDVAHRVAFRPVAARMAFPVDLDREPRIAAKEIQNIGAAGVLAAEFEAARSGSKRAPKQYFRQAHRAPQLPRPRNAATFGFGRDILEQSISPPSVLRTATSPRQARGGFGRGQ